MYKKIYGCATLPILTLTTLLLSACGGGGGSSSSNSNNSTDNINFAQEQLTTPVELNGGGIKGPLAHATVNIYKPDSNFPGFFDPAQPIATGNTDASAAIQNLSLPAGTTLPLILEVDGTDSTDLITDRTPVLKMLKTVITKDQLEAGVPIYATPLSTMTYLVAKNAANNGSVNDFLEQLAPANKLVLSVFNFGLNSNLNTFLTSPLIDSNATTAAQQQLAAEYRAANEALATVVFRATNRLRANASNVSEDIILAQLARDLQADRRIDNRAGGTQLRHAVNLDIISSNVLDLTLPGSQIKISDIASVLEDELQFGNSTATFLIPDYTPPLTQALLNADTDSDGIVNALDSSSSVDSNGVSSGNNNVEPAGAPQYLNPPLMVSDFASIANVPMSVSALRTAYDVSQVNDPGATALNRLRVVERNGQHWLQQTFSHDHGQNSFGRVRTGLQYRMNIPDKHDEMYLSFDIEFTSDFHMTRNGKLGPGLQGGPESTTGGNVPDGYNGFSMRNHFGKRDFGPRADRLPMGTVAPYTYWMDQARTSGDAFALIDPATRARRCGIEVFLSGCSTA